MKCRLADEYDAAQERSEINKHGGHLRKEESNRDSSSSPKEIGFSLKHIHEARIISDAWF
jgi:hypothetical protein